MPEKFAAASPPSWIFRSVHWPFKALILSVFLGVMIACTIDGTNLYIITKPLDKDFNTTSTPTAAVSTTAVSTTAKNDSNNNNVTDILLHSDIVPLSSEKTSTSDLSFKWVSAVAEPNYTATLLARWLTPGGEPCKDSDTEDISIPGLDKGSNNLPNNLSTGEIHEFVIQALDSSGNPRCLGGDYFEIDLSGPSWKSRPPIKDLGNGTYTFSLQVHPSFPGQYNLTVILLYRHYQGLKLSPERLTVDRTLRTIQINFLVPQPQPEKPSPASLGQCRREDFTRDVWSGRWTRHGGNDGCEISNDGRYRCLPGDFPCERPWCDGSLGSIESNGWVYSAHCSFKIFSGGDAWECLNNRWIFFWGDSNHCDTIRNILNFILNVNHVDVVPRLFDANVTNPNNPNQTVRFTSVFNGHYNHTGNYLGLDSLRNEPYREYLKGYFSGEVVPDTVVINSGLHDGVFWRNVRRFSNGAEYAAWFWAGILAGLKRRPDVIYRSTVATGGHARRLVFNPSKMEAFNGILLDKLREFGVVDHVVDHYDMTYPWHYDNRCNDGVHYGRAPAKMRWRDGEIGHQYFVDLMLCHVLLNAMCAR